MIEFPSFLDTGITNGYRSVNQSTGKTLGMTLTQDFMLQHGKPVLKLAPYVWLGLPIDTTFTYIVQAELPGYRLLEAP